MHNTIYVMMAPVLVLPCTWYCYVIIIMTITLYVYVSHSIVLNGC